MPFGQPKKRKSLDEKRAQGAAKSKRHFDKYKSTYGVDPVSVLRNKRRDQIVNAIGGKCQICGYDKLRMNLAFHHLSNKAFKLDIRRFQYKLERILPEIRKCILICHNCHGEVHAGLISKVIIDRAHEELLSRVDKTDYVTPKEVKEEIRNNFRPRGT